MRPSMRVAVIGAGCAGLAAAVELAQAGVEVEIFEAARQPGGRARSVPLDGLELDNGQHILLGAYRHTLAFLDRVNPAWPAQLLRIPLALRVEPGFALATPRLPAPWHLVAALVGARGLGWRDRLAAVSFVAAMRRRHFRLDGDVPVSALLARHRQPEAVARFLWEPLCLAALNTAPAAASGQVFLNVLRDAFARGRADSDLLLPRVGLSRLLAAPATEALVRLGARLHLSAPVRALVPNPRGWRLGAAPATDAFTHVVCALPAARAAALLEPLPGAGATVAALRALDYEPIYTVYLRYADDVRLEAPMLGLAGTPGQWVFDRGQLGGPHGLLAVVISARGPHGTLSPAALGAAVARQLGETLGLSEAPHWVRVIAEKRATFSCRPALRRAQSQTGVTGLFLAGDHVAEPSPEQAYPATIEAAVRSGVQCARLILES